jgi:hypothetical protein
MMSIAQLTTVLQSLFCLAILAPLLLKLWAGARLDSFRQEMFIIRDELFDFASGGKIGFDDPSYRLLRQLMNGFIRYGHQLTFFRICLGAAQVKTLGQEPVNKWTTKWEKAVNNTKDEETKKALEEFHSRAVLCVGKRLILGSPLLLVIFIVGGVVISVHTLIRRISEVSSRATVAAIARVLGRISGEATLATVDRVIDFRLIENEAAATAMA